MNYLIQGIGLLGTVLYFASFQCRENKKAAAEKVLDENWLPAIAKLTEKHISRRIGCYIRTIVNSGEGKKNEETVDCCDDSIAVNQRSVCRYYLSLRRRADRF